MHYYYVVSIKIVRTTYVYTAAWAVVTSVYYNIYIIIGTHVRIATPKVIRPLLSLLQARHCTIITILQSDRHHPRVR